MTAISAIAADRFLDWLNTEFGRNYDFAAGGNLVATDGAKRLHIAVAPLYASDADPSWSRRCQALAGQLQERLGFPLALWVPPDTDLPHGDRSEFVQQIATAAAGLQPGDRGQVEFPVNLTLKKTGAESSYVHVTGGLAPHWAKLTGRAYGQYVLDTTAVHRLPEPQSRVADLLEWVALLGNGMKPGASSEIKAEDSWTITRPRRVSEGAVFGAPPASDPTNGTSVRRYLRAGLRMSAEQADNSGDLRALVLTGIVRTMDEENATIALRSCDPSLYAGLDVIALVADGQCKSLHGSQPDRF
jgi:hypothetical protein